MKPRYAFLIAAILFAILSLLVFVVVSDNRDLMVKIFFVTAIFVAPLFIGEEAYDLIDKKLDRWIGPHQRLEVHWHLVYAALIASIHYVIWPAIVIFFLSHTDLRAWYEYFRPIDESIAWLGYPRYAYDFGILACGLSFFGYMFEWLSRQVKIYLWRRQHGRKS